MKRLIVLYLILLFVVSTSFAQSGTWSGTISVGNFELGLVFNFLDSGKATLDVPDQGAEGIEAIVARTDTGRITISIPGIGATFEGTYLINRICGTFQQMGASLPLTLKPGGIVYNRPQTPTGPFPYSTEEVSFSNGSACLKGTLTLPENCSRETPALVMITGSGLQNRDEELYSHKPFAVIADALARKGIATLRYDDRGFAESTGDVENVTVDDMIGDAVAGIGLLRERFLNVGALGHSEGGTLALKIASEGKADFAVTLAGMVISGKATLLQQNSDALSAAGYAEGVVKEYIRLLNNAFDACISNNSMPSVGDYDLPNELKANYRLVAASLASPYMKSFISIDAESVLGKIACPVLALDGTLDTQVDSKVNLGILSEKLSSAHLVKEVEGVNHLFQHCTTGDASEYKKIEETFAPEVLDIITDWILAL